MLEDALKQIRALLQNQLPAKLDQIELERADGVALEDVYSFHIQSWQKDGRQKYPSVNIVGEATTGTNALSRRRELRHKISVWIMDRVVSPDSELAQTRLLRYVEAMERVLALDPTLGGKVIDSTVTNHDYYFKREDFIKRALLTLNVLEWPSTASY
ncbi:MAG: hypothetical protein AAB048_03035 [Planctomycetota bacterium]